MILLDGALGTLLEARGVPTPAPLWSAAALDTHPHEVARIHAEYAAAGATLHTAATFRAASRSAGGAAEALTRRAIALARGAVPTSHRIAGSMAPLADCWHPDLSPPDPEPEHRVSAALLAAAGVDLLLVETFAHVGEAVAATRAAVATGLETWTSLTPGYDGSLLSPRALAEGARRVADAGSSTVLVNCLPADRALPWVDALAATGLRFGVYANAGPPKAGLAHGQPDGATRYAHLARQWMDRGARVLGGCCGTGPDHIAALARLATRS